MLQRSTWSLSKMQKKGVGGGGGVLKFEKSGDKKV
jgi:hypothetical protein